MTGIINLSDRRKDRGEPIEHVVIELSRYGPGQLPEIRVRGLGDDIATIDYRGFLSLLIGGVGSLANETRRAGGDGPVAFGIFYPTGEVTSFVDLEHISPADAQRRAWLLRSTDTLRKSFGELLDRDAGIGPANDG